MRARVAFLLGLAALGAQPLPAAAQEDDRSYLVAFLEDSLSDAGRDITIKGFSGALSSVASMEEMTIADDEGVWITLRNVSLNWDRAALLSGEVVITSLVAEEILLDRIPSTSDNTAPALEGSGFSLPELPVSVSIGRIAIEHLHLGETILGETVDGTAEASASLIDGEGRLAISLLRQDAGPDGQFSLGVQYLNSNEILAVSLKVQEEADGIAVRLLSVPGTPSAGLTILGAGPLDNFSAQIGLQTDEEPRLTGKITLSGQDNGQRDFAVNISGDLAPVFWPEYRAFLGESLALTATGSTMASGRLELSDFALNSGSLSAKGHLAVGADGLPESFKMNLAVMRDDGAPLLLPLTTDLETRISSARLNLGFDASESDAWTLAGLIIGLDRADISAESLNLSGGGNIRRGPEKGVSTELNFLGTGLAPADAAIAKALGTMLSGRLIANWQSGSGQIDIGELSLAGDDYDAVTSASMEGLSTGFAVDGRIDGTWNDLSRLADLTGLDLAGSAGLSILGKTSALGDAFDLTFAAEGQDLKIGLAEVDNLMAGASRVAGGVSRSATGSTFRDITVDAGQLSGRLNGTLTPEAIAIEADLTLPNLASLGPRYRGQLSGAASYTGTLTDGSLTLTGKGDGLGIGQTEVDRIIAGPADIGVAINLVGGSPHLASFQLDGRSLKLSAVGSLDGTINVQSQLANLGLILPQFPGAVTISGPVRPSETGTTLDLTLKGPAQMAGRIAGTLASSYASADIAFTGQSLAGVANPFIAPRVLSGQLAYDLRLSGPLSLQSLSGRVTLAKGRMADPGLSFGVGSIDATVELSGGTAQINASAKISSGGGVSLQGQTSLAFPYNGDLGAGVQNVTLRQAGLFNTTLHGDLTIKGPLAGGARIEGVLNLGRTELRIPSSGSSGAEPVPDITHVNEPGAVYQTRKYAGLTEKASAGSGGSGNFLLDIQIRAANQVFLRGRGLDAELGGQVRLRGTSADVRPEGSFELIRGRLDLVGRRLILTQAQLMMQGKFVPQLEIVASIEDIDIISTIRISGPATDPELSFESSPQLPDEEVLAQLLFGKRLQTLTAFQAIKLATAVRTLAGIGGEGLVAKIRKRTGLDNLDISTDDTAKPSVAAGKYLSEKFYSEITVAPTGQTQIDLNFVLTPQITLKGKTNSDGNTGVGIFLEKSY
jgi:translocation and assembly module TamB